MRVGWQGWGTYARPQDDALDPQPDEGEERPEGEVDVGVVRAGLLDHAAELGVAVGADHGEDAAGHPDHQAHVDAARALEHAGGRDEDAAADDAADDQLESLRYSGSETSGDVADDEDIIDTLVGSSCAGTVDGDRCFCWNVTTEGNVNSIHVLGINSDAGNSIVISNASMGLLFGGNSSESSAEGLVGVGKSWLEMARIAANTSPV